MHKKSINRIRTSIPSVCEFWNLFHSIWNPRTTIFLKNSSKSFALCSHRVKRATPSVHRSHPGKNSNLQFDNNEKPLAQESGNSEELLDNYLPRTPGHAGYHADLKSHLPPPSQIA